MSFRKQSNSPQKRRLFGAERLEERRLLAVTANLVDGQLSFVSDGVGDPAEVLILGTFAGNLTHNLNLEGSGYANRYDFDPAVPGVQMLPSENIRSLTVDLGTGKDSLILEGDAAFELPAAKIDLAADTIYVMVPKVETGGPGGDQHYRGGVLVGADVVFESSEGSLYFEADINALNDGIAGNSAYGVDIQSPLGATVFGGNLGARSSGVDFDSNGSVDGDDFLIWSAGLWVDQRGDRE